MKIIHTKLLFGTFLILASCSLKSQTQNSIIGKWKSYKTEWRDGSDKTLSGSKMLPKLEVEFTIDNYIIYPYLENDKVKFEYKENYIFIKGVKFYYVEKIDKNELVLITLEKNGLSQFNRRNYLKKVDTFE